MGKTTRKSCAPDERASTTPNKGQKPLSISEMRDEDMEELPDKEFKKIMLKFIRDEEKKREDFRNCIIAEIQQIKTKLDDQELKIESLINRINTADERISETEDMQNEGAQLVKQLETSLSKTNKMIQEMKDHLRKLNIWIIGLPEGVERESGMQAVLDEIIQENF